MRRLQEMLSITVSVVLTVCHFSCFLLPLGGGCFGARSRGCEDSSTPGFQWKHQPLQLDTEVQVSQSLR